MAITLHVDNTQRLYGTPPGLEVTFLVQDDETGLYEYFKESVFAEHPDEGLNQLVHRACMQLADHAEQMRTAARAVGVAHDPRHS